MLLGEIVKSYREEHALSQRDFAARSGLSAGFISMLEKNRNPKTGDPIVPSIITVKKIADAVGSSLEDLMCLMGDNLINIEEPAADESSELDNRIMNLIRQLPEDLKLSLFDLLQAAVVGARGK